MADKEKLGSCLNFSSFSAIQSGMLTLNRLAMFGHQSPSIAEATSTPRNASQRQAPTTRKASTLGAATAPTGAAEMVWAMDASGNERAETANKETKVAGFIFLVSRACRNVRGE